MHYHTFVTLERCQQAVVVAVPDACCMVPTGRDDAPAVRGELRPVDCVGMTRENRQRATIPAVPNASCMVPTSRDDALAVMREESSTEGGSFWLAGTLVDREVYTILEEDT